MKVLRSILAVLTGLVTLTLVSFAFELPLRALVLRLFPEALPDPEALNTNVLWMLSQSAYTLPAAGLGGYLTARLAPAKPMAHALALAIVQELLIVALIFNPPHPVPVWMWAITLVLVPAAILCGGRVRARTR